MSEPKLDQPQGIEVHVNEEWVTKEGKESLVELLHEAGFDPVVVADDELREAIEHLEDADLSDCNIDSRAVAVVLDAAKRFLTREDRP